MYQNNINIKYLLYLVVKPRLPWYSKQMA